MVIEPPCGPLLDLPHGSCVLEASQNRSDGRVVVGIQAVNDGFWQLVRCIQCIQKIRHLCGRRIIVDAVVSCIRPKLVIAEYVVVPFASIMELHRPSQTVIFLPHEDHIGRLELQHLFLRQRTALNTLCKKLLDPGFLCRCVHHVFQSMVRHPAAHAVKKFHSFFQSCL